ncbi:synaptotagmin protein 4-like [Tropilaelaps mercedesae]|uniref:Synaptotagmin protein 4-like n=1 Tax=Tropilaelaps mercedesae TaxID=418985 RepID=A0A1V9XUU5_9ACAR|nr:synaptotagmin protein 4-like [Tropilaelaps mercedesae]
MKGSRIELESQRHSVALNKSQHLKAELQRLRKRGALRPGLDPERSCARCLSPLGRVLNRGAQCPVCRKKVCKDCRLYDSGVLTSPSSTTSNTGSGANNNATHWICVLCQKQL